MKTILVVDDDTIILELTARFLENLSIKPIVLTAENGVEAMAVLKSTKVDLVLTDLGMPVMDGFALLKDISHKHPYIKTIAMTGLQSADIHEEIRFLGVRHCLEKPFSLQDLKRRIIQTLDDNSGKPVPADRFMEGRL